MKKILFLCMFLIGGLAYGQLDSVKVSTPNSGLGDPLRTAFQKVNLAIDQINLNAPAASPTFSGTMTFDNGATIVNTDADNLDITEAKVNITGDLDVSGTVSGANVDITNSVLGVALADSVLYPSGYTTKHQLKTTLTPRASDGAALGSATFMYSDLFLASGGVINFDNGDVTATHSANELKVEGGTLKSSYANAGSYAFQGYNSSTTAGSIGVYGYTYSASGDGIKYGIYGNSGGTDAGATHIGVIGLATGGTYNYAIHAFTGQVKIDNNIIYVQDATGTELTAAGGITEAMLSGYILYNEDSAVDITANPQIANPPTESSGTVIIIQGSSDSNTLKIDDGDGVQLAGDASCTLGAGDILSLIYNGTDWFELYRANN